MFLRQKIKNDSSTNFHERKIMTKKQVTDLFGAIVKGSFDDVRYLVEEKGADVNAKDSKRNTPLHTAVQHWQGDNAMIEFFISHGADVLAQNKKCRTARCCAHIKLNSITADIAGKATLLAQMMEPGNAVAGMPLLKAINKQLDKVKLLMEVIKMLENAAG